MHILVFRLTTVFYGFVIVLIYCSIIFIVSFVLILFMYLTALYVDSLLVAVNKKISYS